MKIFDVYPIYDIEIVKAEGSYLWDNEGCKYLDMYGGHAVISIGHTNPHYVSLLTKQLNNIGFYSNSIKIPLQDELAEKLGRLSGKEDYQLFLCNSGAEANENALKLASFTNGKKKIISFTGGFHGRTSLAVAVTDNPSIIAPVNETDNVIILPFNDIDALTNCFENNEICAVILEAIQGVGGIVIAEDDFIRQIRALCDKYNAVYISDCVQCGCGRSGKYYGSDYAGVNADIYTMAKGIGNGFPLGAISISDKFAPKYGMLGTTFGGNHLACVAAIAVCDEILEHNLIDNAKLMGDYLMSEISKLSKIKQVRGRGLMIGVEMNEDSASLRKQLLFEDKIFVGSSGDKNVFRLLPSLNITKEHCDKLLTALKKYLM